MPPPACLTSRVGFASWRAAYDVAYAMPYASRRFVGKVGGRWVVAFLFQLVVMDGDGEERP